MSRPSRAGFDIKTVPYGDSHQPAVVFTCKGCKVTHTERFATGSLSPEHAAKRTRLLGWKVEPDRSSANECPKCIAKRRAAAKGDKAPSVASPLIPKQENANVVELPKPAAKPEPVVPREPTSQDRFRIRAVLDKQFDDVEGCYLDGYSDQRVGEELKLPWSFVQKIREAAYGPIRVDPEMVALRAEHKRLSEALEGIGKELAPLSEQVEDLRKRGVAMTNEMIALDRRISDLQKKRAA